MRFEWKGMTTTIEKIFLESRKTKLSFAVSLVDEYTNEKPIGGMEVSLKETSKRAVKNPGSYYLFLDLPDDSYTVQVRSEYYFDEDLDINTAGRDPKNPVMLTLKPKPSYLFPPGATLIRGVVYDVYGTPISGAKAKVRGRDVENKTTEEGEFVLYFRALTEDEIIKEGSKRFVKGNGDKIIHLDLEYNRVTKTIELEAEEGKTTFVKIG
jgi:hypothetical protein